MKDATVSARVEYDVKRRAEEILRQIGVPVSVLINSLYRQIIFQRGVPFQLTLPRGRGLGPLATMPRRVRPVNQEPWCSRGVRRLLDN